jgi:hypothetical protein
VSRSRSMSTGQLSVKSLGVLRKDEKSARRRKGRSSDPRRVSEVTGKLKVTLRGQAQLR